MLQELRQMQQGIMDYFQQKNPDADSLIHYQVLHSQIPGVFSMGGDLALFSQAIREKDRETLHKYALQCIDNLYLNSVNLRLPLTTISLVEGDALGGGFECALSSNVLIATENARFGFPEIRFNLFPGMGAYSFLARNCGMVVTERLLTSGETYSAKELYDMGIIHHLGEPDRGVECVEDFMRQHRHAGNSLRALQMVRQRYHPLEYQELVDITEIWVEAALRVTEKDLRLIDRLVKVQSAKIRKGLALLRTKQDRRFNTEQTTFPLKDWSGKTILHDRRKNLDRRLRN